MTLSTDKNAALAVANLLNNSFQVSTAIEEKSNMLGLKRTLQEHLYCSYPTNYNNREKHIDRQITKK